MEKNTIKLNHSLLVGVYIYLCLPIIIFFLGWCRWYIGIPAAIILILSVLLCIKEQDKYQKKDSIWRKEDIPKFFFIILIIMVWVAISGVGGYVWQNSDHWWRNTMFDILVSKKWPVTENIFFDGKIQERGFAYYIGFWLPAACVGKIFGLHAGYAAQYLWSVLGIVLLYAMICTWRKRVLIWPLFLLIFFSGLDLLGSALNLEETVRIFGSDHLERWAVHYQFSCMTTQLFWVFNQAVPAWVASTLIFLSEKPKNIVFSWSLIMITSTLPFAGLLPYIIILLFSRSSWKKEESVVAMIKDIWNNIVSFQNVIGAGTVGIISLIYLTGNVAGGSIRLFSQTFGESISIGLSLILLIVVAVLLIFGITYLILHGYGKILLRIAQIIICCLCVAIGIFVLYNNLVWNTYIYKLCFLILFYIIEAGCYLICLKKDVKDKYLFWATTIWLLIIPLIVVGESIDFCMRASIPGLLLILLWCIEALDKKQRTVYSWILVTLLIIGSVTPIHEIKRTLVNSKEEYEIIRVEESDILSGINFSSDVDGIFWRVIAK